MRIPHTLTSLIGAFTLAALLGVTVVLPETARAQDSESLATTGVDEGAGLCLGTAPTVDDVVSAAATAIRGRVPEGSLADYDREVENFRAALASVRVHRDGLPVSPENVNARTAFLDDPIVTYVVHGLDAVRTGRIEQTLSISRLTVQDVIEVFILGTRVVRIPAELAAALVPTFGFVLKPVVGGAFTGVADLARAVQANVASRCTAPNVYHPLDLDDMETRPVAIPPMIRDMADNLVRASGSCTPIAELTTRELVERVRDYLERSDLPLDRVTVRAAAESAQTYLRDNRVLRVALMRRTEELGPLVEAISYSPVTFLASLGFGITNVSTHQQMDDTVPLAEARVENAMDLAILTMDTASLLISGGTAVAGLTGVGTVITAPISIVQTLFFAPTTYGAPIVKGIMQSMCAV